MANLCRGCFHISQKDIFGGNQLVRLPPPPGSGWGEQECYHYWASEEETPALWTPSGQAPLYSGCVSRTEFAVNAGLKTANWTVCQVSCK